MKGVSTTLTIAVSVFMYVNEVKETIMFMLPNPPPATACKICLRLHLFVSITIEWPLLHVIICVFCSRLLSGHTCCVRWVCLSTSRWTPSTGSRPDALTAALRWVSCLTTAVTPSPPVSLHPVWFCVSENLKLSEQSVCFFSAVFVVLGTSIAAQLGTNPDWMFFCCFAGMFMFYCAHWQTYVSGTLRFGMWVDKNCVFSFSSLREQFTAIFLICQHT